MSLNQGTDLGMPTTRMFRQTLLETSPFLQFPAAKVGRSRSFEPGCTHAEQTRPIFYAFVMGIDGLAPALDSRYLHLNHVHSDAAQENAIPAAAITEDDLRNLLGLTIFPVNASRRKARMLGGWPG